MYLKIGTKWFQRTLASLCKKDQVFMPTVLNISKQGDIQRVKFE